jgi:hypothetical protein
MYIESKEGYSEGPARIGIVKFSKTGRTVYYNNLTFKRRRGICGNFVEIESNTEYWISGPRKDGCDRLFGERVPVEIDEDVREEYWTKIRNQPEKINETSYW